MSVSGPSRLWVSCRSWSALLFAAAALFLLDGCKSIPEGRSSVNEVQIRGANQVDEDDVLDKIATTETPKFLMLFRGILFEYSLYDRFVLQRDLARVEAFYRSKGFYDVHARAGRVHTLDDKHVRVEVIVEEGKAAVVRDVRVNGLDGLPPPVADAARRAATGGLPKNKPFEEEAFQTTEGSVRRALTDVGYAYAKVKSDAAVDVVTHETDVVFDVTPGPKCVFGPVKLQGLGSLPEAPILRTIDIKPGSDYSERTLDDAQQALLDLGVFASVELVPDIPEEPDMEASGAPAVSVLVKLEPARLRTIRLGGGLEFDSLKTDVHGVVGWEDKNFFGGLRTFSVAFRPGVVLYPVRVNNLVAPTDLLPEERLRLDFSLPSFIEARTRAFVRPELNVYPVLINPDPLPDERVIGYGEVRNAIGFERSIWKFFGALSHNTQIDQPFSYVGTRDPTLGLIVISFPELRTSFDFRNDKVHPSEGIYIENTLQVAGNVFGGNAKDLKVQPEVRGYVPLAKKRRVVFATRGSVGFLFPQNYGDVVQNGPSNGTEAPSEARTRDYQLTFFRGFFSGGPNSNRGYPIRGVGPYDVVPFLTPDLALAQLDAQCGPGADEASRARCRSPTGGFTLWEASVEVRVRATGPLSVATFCDTSDVSPRPANLRFSHPHLSCGAGGRYETPAGPIRLDVGYRIPGVQVLGGLTADEREPQLLFGIPIAVHIGIGEAY